MSIPDKYDNIANQCEFLFFTKIQDGFTKHIKTCTIILDKNQLEKYVYVCKI